MKKIILSVVGAVLVFGLLMLASDDFNYLVKSNIRRLTQDPGQLCVDYERDNFSSPKTVKYYKTISHNSDDIAVMVLAKNPLGIEVQDVMHCYLSGGKFNELHHRVKKLTN
ncbi:hypothetical protein [Leminorella grimontii]|uniref:hypothetical protein n=1 Tax=Leminorella grimontii TaxID=82981 RepID=UPI00321F6228